MSIVTNIMNSKVAVGIAKKKPEILFGAGVICGIGAIGMAFEAGTKAQDIIDISKKEIAEVHEVKDNPKIPEEVYSDNDYKKDLVIAYGRAAGRVAKVTVPVFALASLSLALILKSNGIYKARAAAFGLAYTGLSEQFEKYRSRVISEHGEEADKLYANNLFKKDIELEDGLNSKGDPKTKKVKNATIANGNMPESQYARFFDSGSRNWQPNAEDNLVFLRSQQNYFNDMLATHGHVFLNDVYEALGIPKTEGGQYVGWMLGLGDDYIDFGIYDVYKEMNRDFVNGYEPVILLDFNVDGVISHLLGK